MSDAYSLVSCLKASWHSKLEYLECHQVPSLKMLNFGAILTSLGSELHLLMTNVEITPDSLSGSCGTNVKGT